MNCSMQERHGERPEMGRKEHGMAANMEGKKVAMNQNQMCWEPSTSFQSHLHFAYFNLSFVYFNLSLPISI